MSRFRSAPPPFDTWLNWARLPYRPALRLRPRPGEEIRLDPKLRRRNRLAGGPSSPVRLVLRRCDRASHDIIHLRDFQMVDKDLPARGSPIFQSLITRNFNRTPNGAPDTTDGSDSDPRSDRASQGSPVRLGAPIWTGAHAHWAVCLGPWNFRPFLSSVSGEEVDIR